MDTISMHDLKNKLGKLTADEVILDVRTPEEYHEGHIKGARNITHEEVTKHAEELKKFKRVYIHCRSGKRAQVAYHDLAKAGLDNLVCIAGGGMMDWISAGYPVEK